MWVGERGMFDGEGEVGPSVSRRAERTWAPSRCRIGRRLRKNRERVMVDVYLKTKALLDDNPRN